MELLDEVGEVEEEYHIRPRHGDKTTFDEHQKAKEKVEELEQRNKDVNYEIEVEREIV
jgi:hypothetical protein